MTATKTYLKIPANVQVVENKNKPVSLVNDYGVQFVFTPVGDGMVDVRFTKGRAKDHYSLSVEEARDYYRDLLKKGYYRW